MRRGFSFIIATAVALMAAAGSARAEQIENGLYLRTLYAFGNLSINTVYFGAGNKIVIDPSCGTDPIDFDAEAKANPKKVGTYALAGSTITVTWGGGAKAEKLSVEFEKGTLSAYDGGLVSKADAFPKNHRLNGTYAWGGTTANVSASKTLAFSGDGTFSMNALGGIHHIPGKGGVAEKTDSGTYTLSGNTLTLSANGQTAKHTVIPMNTALDPAKAKVGDDHLIFDGLNLKREK